MYVREERYVRIRIPSGGLDLDVRHGVIPHGEERTIRVVCTAPVSVCRFIDPSGVLGLAATEGFVKYVANTLRLSAEDRLKEFRRGNPSSIKAGLIDDVGVEGLDELFKVSAKQLLNVRAPEDFLESPVLSGDIQGMDKDSALRAPERVALSVVRLDVHLYAEGHKGPVGHRDFLAGKPDDAGALPDLHGMCQQGRVKDVVVHGALPVALDDINHARDGVPLLLGERPGLLDGFKRLPAYGLQLYLGGALLIYFDKRTDILRNRTSGSKYLIGLLAR